MWFVDTDLRDCLHLDFNFLNNSMFYFPKQYILYSCVSAPDNTTTPSHLAEARTDAAETYSPLEYVLYAIIIEWFLFIRGLQ